jgi:hypothetical protein
VVQCGLPMFGGGAMTEARRWWDVWPGNDRKGACVGYSALLLRVDSRCGDGNGVLYCIATCQCCCRQGEEKKECVVVCVASRTKQSQRRRARQMEDLEESGAASLAA